MRLTETVTARLSSSIWVPVSGLVVAMALWGSSFIAMKVALRTFDPAVVMGGRMIVATLIFILLRKKFGKVDYRPGDWKLLAFMAFCEPCLYFSFETHALQYTSASEAAMITALLPAMTIVGARIVLGERITSRNVTGLMLAIIGVVVLTWYGQPSPHAPCSSLGNALEFAAMVFATGYTLTSRHLAVRYSPFCLTGVQAFVGSAFFMPALFLPATKVPVTAGWQPVVAVLYLGAVVNVLAYFLYNYGLSRIPASEASPYVNLIPIFSMVLGWMILGEQLTSVQYVAAGVILGGTVAGQGRPSLTS